VVAQLADVAGVDAFELNVSCPNVKAGGLEFGADPRALREVVRMAREATARPLFVKLSPALADIAAAARIAVDAGADAITLVNTIPALAIDVELRRPALGFGTGGLSGAALLPVGVRATWMVRRAVNVPIVGVGGIASGTDAVQYMLAGASLVAIGTAALRDPRAPERVVRELDAWCRAHDVSSVHDLTGTLEWTS
jgi:dihydroorotate dehydrogenase (NAD+) catalytic subunit